MQDEKAPEPEAFLQGAVLWSPQAKAGLVNANQKEWGYVKLLHGGSYLRGVQGEGSGSSLGSLGKSYQELPFTLNSASFYLRHVLA